MIDVRACAADAAPVRAEPADASEQVTQALRDEPLAVEAVDGEWATPLEESQLRPGDLVCFTALGAGLHWGAGLLRA